MEMFNEFSGMMKKSVAQYTDFAKKMQESTTQAMEWQMQATKEYMDWSMKTNAKLMEDFLAYTSTARDAMSDNVSNLTKSFEKTGSPKKTA